MERKHRTKKRPSHRPAEAAEGFPVLLTHGILGAGIALLAGLLLLLGGAGLCLSSSDPNRLVRPLGLCFLYLSALFGGVATIRLHKRAPLPCGGICGILLVVFTLFLTFFFRGEEASLSLGLSLLLRAFILPVCVAGAWLGQKRTRRGGRRR